jgi:predicted secreted protein
MTKQAGKDAIMKVAYMGATALTDISAYLTSVSGPEFDIGVAETSTLGGHFKTYVLTQVNPGVLSLEGVFEDAIGSALFALGTAGTATGFEFYPQGTASGKTKYSGSAIVTGFAPSADRDDAVLFSASMQLTGTVTVGTA